MIIVPHHVNSYICNTSDIIYSVSGSYISGLSEEGAVVYDVNSNKSYIVLQDLTLAPLVINVA